MVVEKLTFMITMLIRSKVYTALCSLHDISLDHHSSLARCRGQMRKLRFRDENREIEGNWFFKIITTETNV